MNRKFVTAGESALIYIKYECSPLYSNFMPISILIHDCQYFIFVRHLSPTETSLILPLYC